MIVEAERGKALEFGTLQDDADHRRWQAFHARDGESAPPKFMPNAEHIGDLIHLEFPPLEFPVRSRWRRLR